MAAPWNRPQHEGFAQNNQRGSFPGRRNYSERPNNLNKNAVRPTRPYSSIRNDAPRHFQENSPRHPHRFQRPPHPRDNAPYTGQDQHMQPPYQQPPPQQGTAPAGAKKGIPYNFNNPNPQYPPPGQQYADSSTPNQQYAQNAATNRQYGGMNNQNFRDTRGSQSQSVPESFDRYPGLLDSNSVFHTQSQPPQQRGFNMVGNEQDGLASGRLKPDSMGAAARQEDPERQCAEKWINNWLKERKKSDKHGEVIKSLTICEAQDRTRQMIILLAKLQLHKQQLESMKAEDKSIWEQKLREVTKIKAELEGLHHRLTCKETVTELAKKIRQRQSKRRRLKRLRHERYIREQEELAGRERRHREMDAHMEQVKQKHEQQKQEEAMKKEGDQILSEVKKKIAEANKSTQLIESLQKLRKLRVDRFERQGVLGQLEGLGVGPGHQKAFEDGVTTMAQLLNTQLETYRAEESALKVILETEQSETREKEREKLLQKQKEQKARELKKEERQLFGSHKDAQPGDPVFPFAQYYKAAETSTDALITIRHEWDRFLVQPGTPGGSQIPTTWVYPSKPSSDTWHSALVDNT